MTDSAFHSLGEERVLVIAMRGWSDAGDAASGAVDVVRDAFSLERTVTVIDDEVYFDFLANRPRITASGTSRELEWPGATMYGPGEPGAPGVYVLIGDEPALRWRSFAAEVLEACRMEGITSIILVGALLADAPHTRDIRVGITSESPVLQARYDVRGSSYEGPVGIMSIIADFADRAGMSLMSLWGSVPHYAQSPDLPAAKATLALSDSLAELLVFEFDREPLEAAAETWEQRISEAVENDDDLVNYVRFLEHTRDVVDSEAATGDAIAAEFEAFLSADEDATASRAGDDNDDPNLSGDASEGESDLSTSADDSVTDHDGGDSSEQDTPDDESPRSDSSERDDD